MHFTFALTVATLLLGATAQKFNLKDSYIGPDFFESFEWNQFNDPTHGRVNYVSQDQAMNMNLSWASKDIFIMRADNFSIVPSSSKTGRNSVRIQSVKAYGDSVTVLDLQHMPEGCATWPAFWTISQRGPWPHGGEIDIVEGVNRQSTNLATLHTTPNCTMPPAGDMSGQTRSTNCDASINNNQGCGVSFTQPNSYGSGLNAAGGGWFAMKRTTADGVTMWFWSRSDPTVPHVIKYGGGNVQPDMTWGVPSARFVPTQCDMSQHFDSHAIIFDVTFCGDWAGSAFASSGCSQQSCNDYVDNNPSAFNNAYWEINSLRIYAS